MGSHMPGVPVMTVSEKPIQMDRDELKRILWQLQEEARKGLLDDTRQKDALSFVHDGLLWTINRL